MILQPASHIYPAATALRYPFTDYLFLKFVCGPLQALRPLHLTAVAEPSCDTDH